MDIKSNGTYSSALEIIKKGAELLKDEKQKEYFADVIKSLGVAEDLVNNEEKAARMIDATVKFANQLCFILFREGTITEELTAELRELPSPEQTSEPVKAFSDERDSRIDEINKKHAAIIDEQKELDIFLGVIAGMSAEEAARRMQEHDEQVKKAAAALEG